MKRFFIKTLGCKTNQIESAIIEEKLIADGFFSSNNVSECDYFILNSCSVTDTADSKTMVLLKKAKKENPQIKTVLTGCFAQLMAEKLKVCDFIDYIVGNEEKTNIAEIIKTDIKYAVSDIFEHETFKYDKLNSLKRTRATIKIQDGCNNRCAYCTIPLARGKNRSNNINNVIEQVNILVEHGYKEVVLTGIHIGQWGMDFKDGSKLIDLLKAIDKTSVHRYRLGSLNPLEFDDELVEFLKKSEKFCPHFHMSLQSACNKTLKNMNRHYSQEISSKLLENLAEYTMF
jgi:threonylcarbamoyladenosine tRNA methylthiotransferase MtaB